MRRIPRTNGFQPIARLTAGEAHAQRATSLIKGMASSRARAWRRRPGVGIGSSRPPQSVGDRRPGRCYLTPPMPRLVVPCARGTEPYVHRGEPALGVSAAIAGRGEASGECDYATAALRVCMFSRVGNRVLCPIASFGAPDPDALYAGLHALPIEDHLAPGRSFAIDVTLGLGVGELLRHALSPSAARTPSSTGCATSAASRTSIAIVPTSACTCISPTGRSKTCAVDLAGESLHRRGYRSDGRQAPLRDARCRAALRDEVAAEPRPARLLCDPMCSSGTIVLEAHAHARRSRARPLAPALGLLGLERARKLRAGSPSPRRHASAHARASAPWMPARASTATAKTPRPSRPRSATPRSVSADARASPVASLEQLEPPPGTGLLLTNPPYGERLGDEASLPPLYRALGDILRRRFGGWTAGVLTALGPLPGAIGLRPTRRGMLPSGMGPSSVACSICQSRQNPSSPGKDPRGASQLEGPLARVFEPRHEEPEAPVEVGAARALRVSHLRRRSARVRGRRRSVRARPSSRAHRCSRAGPMCRSTRRRRDRAHQSREAPQPTCSRLPEVLSIPPEHVVFRKRRRQRPGDQYEAEAEGERLIVEEAGHRFYVRLGDYVDTGLFLDQRTLRQRIAEASPNKNILNLFSYRERHGLRGQGRRARRPASTSPRPTSRGPKTTSRSTMSIMSDIA